MRVSIELTGQQVSSIIGPSVVSGGLISARKHRVAWTGKSSNSDGNPRNLEQNKNRKGHWLRGYIMYDMGSSTCFHLEKEGGEGGGERRVGRQVPLTASALDSGSRDRGSNTGISLNISAYHASAHSRVYFSTSEGTVRKTTDKFLRGGVGEIPSPMSFHRHLPTSRY